MGVDLVVTKTPPKTHLSFCVTQYPPTFFDGGTRQPLTGTVGRVPVQQKAHKSQERQASVCPT